MIVIFLCPGTRPSPSLPRSGSGERYQRPDRYATLKGITHPALIVHGSKDIVVTPINAFILAEHLPNAQLIMYPDSSHGAFYQHRKAFLEHVKTVLSDGD